MYFVDLSAVNVDGPNVTLAGPAENSISAKVISVPVPCGDSVGVDGAGVVVGVDGAGVVVGVDGAGVVVGVDGAV